MGLETFRPYLLGAPFVLRTHHNALVWLMNFKEPEGQVARWLETLAEYGFKIEHRSGKKHLNADALVGKIQAQLARIPHNLRPSLAVLGKLQPARIPHNLRPSLAVRCRWQLTRIPHNLRPSLVVPGRFQPARIPHNLRPWLAVLHRLQLARIPHALRPTLAVNCRTHPATPGWPSCTDCN